MSRARAVKGDAVTILEAELAEHARVARRVSEEMVAGIAELAELVTRTLEDGGKLLLCGNGGSAADAQHLAAEYVVRFGRERAPLPAIALTTDTSVLTAMGNDGGYERIFERQVRALAGPRDLLLLHSTSGVSPNLLLAADAARAVGARSAALLAAGGGPLRERVDLALVVPTDSTPRAQEMHILIGHLVCELVDRAFAR
ncbi:MAG TPA: SIS domain-containing protein [Longimicrobiales bacterium]|nr:SIS domain-containing protein [Longimicrobiales bacterium]